MAVNKNFECVECKNYPICMVKDKMAGLVCGIEKEIAEFPEPYENKTVGYATISVACNFFTSAKIKKEPAFCAIPDQANDRLIRVK